MKLASKLRHCLKDMDNITRLLLQARPDSEEHKTRLLTDILKQLECVKEEERKDMNLKAPSSVNLRPRRLKDLELADFRLEPHIKHHSKYQREASEQGRGYIFRQSGNVRSPPPTIRRLHSDILSYRKELEKKFKL